MPEFYFNMHVRTEWMQHNGRRQHFQYFIGIISFLVALGVIVPKVVEEVSLCAHAMHGHWSLQFGRNFHLLFENLHLCYITARFNYSAT